MTRDARRYAETLVAAGLLGFLEVVATYATGRVHASDVVPIFACGFAAGLVLSRVGLALARRLGLTAGACSGAALVAPLVPLLVRLGRHAPALLALAREPRVTAGAVALGCLVGAVALAASGRTRRTWPAVLMVFLLGTGAYGFARRLGGRWERPGELAGQPSRGGGEQLNLLLVTLDTVRADHLSAYGYGKDTTPFLRELAGEGLTVERAYAASPYTLGSHASLFTGLLPSRHGAHALPFTRRQALGAQTEPFDDGALRPGIKTLAQSLGERGYRTGAIVANGAYLARWTGLDRGFETYDANTSALRWGYVPLARYAARALWPALDRRMSYAPQWHAAQITDAATRWLANVRGQRFFLFLNYLDAHAPYSRAAADSTRFRAPGIECRGVSFTPLEEEVMTGRQGLGPRERSCLLAQYDASLFSLDAELRRLMQALAATGQLENTLVVITSDHGEHFGEHALMGHDNGLYDELLRVPLLIRDPRVRGARVASGPVLLQDLSKWLTASLREVTALPSVAAAPRVVAEHWTRDKLHRRNQTRFRSEYSRVIYAWPYKLVDERDAPALYDLVSDPEEALNLLRDGRPDAAARREALLAAVPAVAEERIEPALADTESLERLRALGYVQ